MAATYQRVSGPIDNRKAVQLRLAAKVYFLENQELTPIMKSFLACAAGSAKVLHIGSTTHPQNERKENDHETNQPRR